MAAMLGAQSPALSVLVQPRSSHTEKTTAGELASYADALWARHAIFLSHEHVRGGGILRDEPKERLRRRLLENEPKCKKAAKEYNKEH